METQNETDAERTVLGITSFGTLSIVGLEQSEHTGISNVVPLSPDKVQGRGTALALTLLKVLLCQPSRFASRDQLMETLWPDNARGKAQARLDDTASVLRTLLRSISGRRVNLLPSFHSSKESGNGYHLAPYPLVWIDVDAFLWNAEQAARMERFGDDPVPYWERAYALASRGMFLADEPYSEWAHEHRELLTGQYRQCVHQLARLYCEGGGQTQAEQVLRAYVLSHRSDEDALRPLMELLGAQERYQEAEACYQQFLEALEQEGPGRQPDPRTRDMREFLHTKQIYRKQKESVSSEIATLQNITTSRNITLFSSLSAIQHPYHAIGIPSFPSQEYSVQSRPDGRREQVGIRFPARGLNNVHTLESGITYMKESRRHLLQRMLSIAGSIAAASHAVFEITSLERVAEALASLSKIDDITLVHLETITRSYWHLFLHAPSKSDLLSSFWGHLQTILQFLKHAPSGAIRNRLYSIAGESAQMIGEILFDLQDYQNAQIYYNFSIYAAKEAGNNAFRAVGLGRLSFLPIYQDEPMQACPLLQEAKQLLTYIPRPMINSWLAVVEAEVMAHLHDEIACERALEQAVGSYHQEVAEEDMLWTRLNDATIPGYKGACYLQLQQPHKALDVLRETLTSIPEYSPRHQSIVITDIAAALLQMEEIEETCKLLHQALEITKQTKSLMVLMRMQHVRKDLERWNNTSYVKQLDTSISEILPNIIA